jgi:hypothetical protein
MDSLHFQIICFKRALSVCRSRPPVQFQLTGVPEPTHDPAACRRHNCAGKTDRPT